MIQKTSRSSPNYTKQLALAIALCTLGATAFWLEYAKKPAEERKKSDEKKVFAVSGATIQRIEVRGTSPTSTLNTVLECLSVSEGLCKADDTSKWEMTAPLKTSADNTTVNSMVKNFGNLVFSEIVDLSTETAEKRQKLLKDYGLSDEQRKDLKTNQISFVLADGRVLRASFGEKHPINDEHFAVLEINGKVDETRVFSVPQWQLAVFGQKTSYFRDKRLLTLEEKKIEQFTLRSSKETGQVIGIRDEKTKSWSVSYNGKTSAGDTDVIDSLLSGAVHLSARDILAERKDSPEAKKILSGLKPRYELTLKTKDLTKEIHFFEKPKSLKDEVHFYGFVNDQDPLVEVDPLSLEKIEKTFSDLLAAKLIPIADRYSFSTIVVSVKGKKAFSQTLKKNAGSWLLDGKEIPKNRMETILDRLTSKSVIAFSAGEPTGEVLKIDFMRAAEKAYGLEFWRSGTKLFARNLKKAGNDTFELTPDLAAQLPWDESFLKETL